MKTEGWLTSQNAKMSAKNSNKDIALEDLWIVARVFLNILISKTFKIQLAKHHESFLRNVYSAYQKDFKKPSKYKSLMRYSIVKQMIRAFQISDKKKQDADIKFILEQTKILNLNQNITQATERAFHRQMKISLRGGRSKANQAIELIPYYLSNYNETQFYRDKNRAEGLSQILTQFYLIKIDPLHAIIALLVKLVGIKQDDAKFLVALGIKERIIDSENRTTISGLGGLIDPLGD